MTNNTKEQRTTNRIDTKRIVIMGMFAALSVASLYTPLRMPFPLAPFLEYDPADIMIIVAVIAFGISHGLILTFIVSALQSMTVSAGSGFYGFLMHMIATGTLVVVIGLINKMGTAPSMPRLIGALVAGVIAMTVMMAIANILITPFFMGVPAKEVVKMIVPIFVPFNLFKGGINAVMAFVLKKTLDRIGLLAN